MKEKIMMDKETLRKVIALLIAEETGIAGELNQDDYSFEEDVDIILTLARGLYLSPEFRTDIIELAEEILAYSNMKFGTKKWKISTRKISGINS